MKRRLLVLLLVLGVGAATSVGVRAEDKTTNIISVATNAGLAYIVGQTGTNNYLEIRNGGGLTNVTGTIGFSASASNNNAVVTVAGSRWINTGDLYVGATGSANRLTVTNGGRVNDDYAYVGFDVTSFSNKVLVTGSGSVWESASQVAIGYGGIGNQLTATNGGQVICHSDSFVGGFDSPASNNTALVTGSSSVWTSDGDLYVGYFSPGNQLTITNGGRVTNQFGFIGAFGSSSNRVLVNGANSTWSMIGGYLTLGVQDSANNQLVITNGGQVNSLGAFMGDSDFAGSNQVLVGGANSLWTVNGDLYAGHFGSSNLLTIQSGGQVGSANGYIGYYPGAGGNQALVTNASSLWTVSGDLYTGYFGSSNLLTIQSGGQVSVTNGYIGYDTEGVGNQALVTGANSLWTVSGDLHTGYFGSSNLLTIQNGGQVSVTNGYIGYDTEASGNAVLVTGSGSRWTNLANLFVGYVGNWNQLTISSTGQVVSVNGYIGGGDSGSSNLVLVTGSGAQWSNNVAMEVGYYGMANSLVISNGGKVICGFGRVGTYGSNSLALVTGTNSQWLDSGDLYVGHVGPSNVLTIASGGLVSNVNAYVGLFGNNTLALVTDNGTLWKIGGDLVVGYGGANNQLAILSGALVLTTNVVVGFTTDSTSNLLSVSGANLIVTNAANTALIDVEGGTLYVSNATVKTATLLLGTNGLLTGVGTVTASSVTNSGMIAPGNSPGRLIIAGKLTLQSSSTLSFELGGYSPGTNYDSLIISNAVQLGGALAVRFINGFQNTMTNGASFTVMTAGSIAGSFANAPSGSRLFTADGFADFLVTYSGTSLTLSQPSFDSDNDGIPNWWMMQYFGHPTGQAADNSRATDDADGDGMSNWAEYLAGTNPTDRNSNLRITAVQRQSNDVSVTWTTVGGKKYVLQGASGTPQGSFTNNFTDISPQIIGPGAGESATNYIEPGAFTNGPVRYYRVRLVP